MLKYVLTLFNYFNMAFIAASREDYIPILFLNDFMLPAIFLEDIAKWKHTGLMILISLVLVIKTVNNKICFNQLIKRFPEYGK